MQKIIQNPNVYTNKVETKKQFEYTNYQNNKLILFSKEKIKCYLCICGNESKIERKKK